MSAKLLERIGNSAFQAKICTASDLFHVVEDGMVIAMSGFTPSGYPKQFPIEFAEYVVENELDIGVSVLSGASIGSNTEDAWAEARITRARYPYQAGPIIKDQINSGLVDFQDYHLANYAHQILTGYFGNVDVGIIECTEIREDGGIVLAGSVGIVPQIIQSADKIILEINTQLPSMYGLHDLALDGAPPNTPCYCVHSVDDRIGDYTLPIDLDRVVGIVEGTIPDVPVTLFPPSEDHVRIADHIIEFFEEQVELGTIKNRLLPLQSGVGNIANAVIDGLKNSNFERLTVWTEVIQDTTLDLIDIGKVTHCTGTSLTLSKEGNERFYSNFDFYKDHVVLRPMFISNGCFSVQNLGVIAMNTPVEVDIYGHVNSTHVLGSQIIHGIGGSGDFLSDAAISIVHTPSVRGKDNNISCIVPMVSHCDHTEHDIHVVVTEQGLADVRGLPPIKRARKIIEKCAHPDYKQQLTDYLDRALDRSMLHHKGHEPVLLSKCFKMHCNFIENGTMKLDNWDD